jgi:hypothetical protein
MNHGYDDPRVVSSLGDRRRTVRQDCIIAAALRDKRRSVVRGGAY